MTYTSKYWDNIARKIRKSPVQKQIAIYKRKEYINLIKSWIKNKNKKKVLKTDLFEEAFGDDYFFDYLNKNFSEAIGIDISQVIVNKTKKRLKRKTQKVFKFVNDDIKSTKFKNNYFDTIISSSTLDHLRKRDMIKSLKEIHRILKKNGQLILSIDNKDNLLYYLGFRINKFFNLSGYPLVSCYSLKELLEIVNNCGFKVKQYTSIVNIPTPFNRIALIMEKFKLPYHKKIINSIITFSKNKLSNRLDTGWFLALNLKKE